MRRTKALQKKRANWLWRSTDGNIWSVYTMKSDHMLNVMKMLYNEIAEVEGLRIVNKTIDGLKASSMTPQQKVETLLMLLDELLSRTDLPRRMEDDLKRIQIEIDRIVRPEGPTGIESQNAIEYFRQLRKEA